VSLAYPSMLSGSIPLKALKVQKNKDPAGAEPLFFEW
jgi:hypothetical protein